MRAVEFTIDLSRKTTATIPADVAAQLPESGQARVIILAPEDADDSGWTLGGYEQFARDDSPEDAVYDDK